MICSVCEDCGWVCENHPDKPWEGEHACTCGGPEPRVRIATRLTMIWRRECRRALKSNSTRRAGVISNRGWQRRFDEPIPLPPCSKKSPVRGEPSRRGTEAGSNDAQEAPSGPYHRLRRMTVRCRTLEICFG